MKKTLIFLFLSVLLTSCNNSQPKITHIIVKSDRDGTLLDSKDREILKQIEKIFYKKTEDLNSSPEFIFLLDITRSSQTVRWHYSASGYIRNYEENNSPIFRIHSVGKFNTLLNIPKDK
ncbi:MAG TPA: hypothetical protein ENJ41_04835 [Oceanospirillales bacterium]|nr:hypothetical protein [Oceanospirillales bacterium]